MAISGQSRTSIDTSPTSEEIFEILSNRRRRFTLHHLLQQDDGTGELRDVSRRVAAWENDIDTDSVSYDQRRNVYTALK